ncbi:DUF4145 domain-containing protein [Aphanizomenon flos-aquae]|jgi:hypothetical protein|uniref:DUF4145 domain-containing protein n=1 Tax=Aphanizomenon flos-aquae FACHB-1040 TaxID=2692887 RepID=A0ABR8BR78_APHFL|nr:DUF4145 domain-containing protein [Aphanizomenon flos-aquae]MBD2276945.1 DUF4145 domain-containing protein [Aphanizomenon flos-aquae FACHB-1040]
MTEQKHKHTAKTVRCGHCGNKTLMKVISEGEYTTTFLDDREEKYYHYRDVQTLLCPNCEKFNVILEEFNTFDSVYESRNTSFLYPHLKEFANKSRETRNIINTYREARNCLDANLCTASVVMCRKTMEMLCLYFKIEHPDNLHGKLARMRDEEIIDNKFYEWANHLKSFGNEAVHTSEQFSGKDAQDILDFTYALVEYCIDFNDKFENLLERRGKIQPSPDLERMILTHETINILVQKLLDDRETLGMRYYAASTLAKKNIEIEKVIPVLLNLIDIPKFGTNATNCLKALGSKAIPELINVLEKHTHHNVRLSAVTILSDIGTNSPDVVEALIKALKDKNKDVQHKAGIALEKLDNIAIDAFVKMYPLPPVS